VTATVILVLDVDQDCDARRLRAGVMRIDVRDDDIDTLGRPARLVRLTEQALIIGIKHRAEHHHARSERELRGSIVPSGPGMIRCRSKPKTLHEKSIAAGASR